MCFPLRVVVDLHSSQIDDFLPILAPLIFDCLCAPAVLAITPGCEMADDHRIEGAADEARGDEACQSQGLVTNSIL